MVHFTSCCSGRTEVVDKACAGVSNLGVAEAGHSLDKEVRALLKRLTLSPGCVSLAKPVGAEPLVFGSVRLPHTCRV